MGKAKKEKNRRASEKAKTAPGSERISKPLKGENFYRDAKAVKQARMLKSGRPTRNAEGKIVKAGEFQSRLPVGTVARVQGHKGWFGKLLVHGRLSVN
jgi:nuclear GTP-binding protein